MRPQLEYASTVWSPHTATDITKLEAVQCRSGRWATRDYQRTSSVTQMIMMIKDLNWCTLEQRRIDSRLTLMYKITYDLVAIPAADYLIPNASDQGSLSLALTREVNLATESSAPSAERESASDLLKCLVMKNVTVSVSSKSTELCGRPDKTMGRND